MQEIYTAEQAKTLLAAKDLPPPIAGEVLRLAKTMDHYYGADRNGPLEDGGIDLMAPARLLPEVVAEL